MVLAYVASWRIPGQGGSLPDFRVVPPVAKVLVEVPESNYAWGDRLARQFRDIVYYEAPQWSSLDLLNNRANNHDYLIGLLMLLADEEMTVLNPNGMTGPKITSKKAARLLLEATLPLLP